MLDSGVCIWLGVLGSNLFSTSAKQVCLVVSLLFCGVVVANQDDGKLMTQSDMQIDPTLAFPEAMGFGRYTVGGKGGELYVVTNLNDDVKHPQPGSFRYGINQKHPRIIVFAVSGVIMLQGPLKVHHGRLTIAGQTSPRGVVVAGAPVSMTGISQVIVRHMRFRLGTFGYADDAVTVRDSHDVIFDHCSFSWSVDETATFYNNRNFTLQNSLITFSLNHSIHPKGQHGFGGIWGGANASFIGNIVANHASRTPRINGHRLRSPYTQAEEFVELVNNIFFNWGHNNVYGSENGRFNLINNYYQPGPAEKRHQFVDISYSPAIKQNQAYVAGNVYAGDAMLTKDNWRGVNYRLEKEGKRTPSKIDSVWLSPQPLTPNSVVNITIPTMSAKQHFDKVLLLQSSGANRNATGGFLDEVDQLLYKQLSGEVNITGDGLIDHENQLIGSWDKYGRQFFPSTAIAESTPSHSREAWLAQHHLKEGDAQALDDYLNKLAQ